MINTDVPPTLHRFRDIAFDRSNLLHLATPLAFNCPTEGFPWDDLRKIFCECQWMASQGTNRCRKIAENSNRLRIVHELHRQTTDRRTDGRHSERERNFTFAKNKWRNTFRWLGSPMVRALDSRLDCREFDSPPPRLVLGWVTVFGRANHLSILLSHPGQLIFPPGKLCHPSLPYLSALEISSS